MAKAKKAAPAKKKAVVAKSKAKASPAAEPVSEPETETESPPSPDAASPPSPASSGGESSATKKKGRGRPPAATPKKAAPASKKKSPAAKRKSESKAKETPKPKPPTAKKSKKDASSESEEEDETDYEVERILEVQFLRNGKREFLIQWKGFGKANSTWEPEENLDCKDLLQAFMSKLDNSDVPRSRRVSARSSTVRSTRASVSRQLERVKEGRVGKSRSRSRLPTNVKSTGTGGLSLAEEVRRLNGEAAKGTPRRLVSLEEAAGPQRSLARAALLSAGMAISIGTALLLSSASTLNWDNVSHAVLTQIHLLRDKLTSG